MCGFFFNHLAIRVDAVSMKPDNTKRHSAVEVNADSTSAIVDGLAEKTEYMLTVTTITEEYFDNLQEGILPIYFSHVDSSTVKNISLKIKAVVSFL